MVGLPKGGRHRTWLEARKKVYTYIYIVYIYTYNYIACLARRLLAGWLAGWLAGRLLAGWMSGRLDGWMHGWTRWMGWLEP